MESFGQGIGERSSTRKILRVRAVVQVRSEGLSYEVKTENLGTDGLAFRTNNHIPDRTPLLIMFSMFHASSLVSVKLEGTVTYSLLSANSFLTGLKFSTVSDSNKRLINAYMVGR